MYSQFASLLRGLVLPFGQIQGTRLVLDGVNGRISAYNAADQEIIREDSATGAITAGLQLAARVVMDGLNARLSLFNAANVERVQLDAAASTVAAGDLAGARVVMDGANARLSLFNAGNAERLRLDAATSSATAGNMGGARVTVDGQASQVRLTNSAGSDQIVLDAAAGQLTVKSASTTENIQIDPGGVSPHIYFNHESWINSPFVDGIEMSAAASSTYRGRFQAATTYALMDMPAVSGGGSVASIFVGPGGVQVATPTNLGVVNSAATAWAPITCADITAVGNIAAQGTIIGSNKTAGGISTATTGAGGTWSIATGLSSITGASVSNGNGGGRPGTLFEITGHSGGTLSGVCRACTTGTLLGSGIAVSIGWIAVGT